MIPTTNPSSSLDRAKKLVSLCLAASLAASTSFAQAPSADSMRRLQDENAALRKRLAELEGKAAPAAPAPSADPGPSLPLRARIEAVESSIIADAYQQCGRNQSETARRLGISRPALIEKLHKYGLMERSPL